MEEEAEVEEEEAVVIVRAGGEKGRGKSATDDGPPRKSGRVRAGAVCAVRAEAPFARANFDRRDDADLVAHKPRSTGSPGRSGGGGCGGGGGGYCCGRCGRPAGRGKPLFLLRNCPLRV